MDANDKSIVGSLASKVRALRQDKYTEASRKRLSNIVTTKMRTSFIGALAAFEENFGHLWGYKLLDNELTPEQREFKDLWEKTRTQVLNNGNNQLRACLNEIGNHIVSWQRYTTNLVIKKEDDNG